MECKVFIEGQPIGNSFLLSHLAAGLHYKRKWYRMKDVSPDV